MFIYFAKWKLWFGSDAVMNIELLSPLSAAHGSLVDAVLNAL